MVAMEKLMSENPVDVGTKTARGTIVQPVIRDTVSLGRRSASPESDGQQVRERKRSRNRKRRKLLFLAFCAVITATAVAVWWWLRPDTGRADSVATTTQVVRRDFSSSVLATGAVKPQVGAQVRVGARISGKVEKLRANIGDSVRTGQIIAELEKADLQAVVGQRQAELNLAEAKLAAVESLLPREIEKAESDVTRWEATLAMSQKDHQRQSRLLPKNAVSQDDWEKSEERMKVAQAALASARAALDLAANDKSRIVDRLSPTSPARENR